MKPTTRFEVFKRDKFTCRYCGKKSPEAILEIDHIVPLAAGGWSELENLVTACYECNRGKGAKFLSEVPAGESLHERTVLLAEQELQIAEYNHWRHQRREREDKEIAAFFQAWPYRDRWVKVSDVRLVFRTLGTDEVYDVLEYVTEHVVKRESKSIDETAWIMFVAICWRRIKNPRPDA